MREIAFKAFIKKANIIIDSITIYPDNRNIGIGSDELKEVVEQYGLLLEDDGDFIMDKEGNKLCEVIRGEDWYWIESGNYELVQFTGLKDKSGEKIFESDIIKTDQQTLFIVEWENEALMWVLLQANKGSHKQLQGEHSHLQKYMQPNLEIVGNIYENHELLSTSI